MALQTLPEIARTYLGLALGDTAVLAGATYPDDSPDEPVVESLNQTVERAVESSARLT